jgi:hypothetical protein
MAKPPTKRGVARFKERELARAVRAARSAGGVERVEVTRDGVINVILAPKDGEAKQTGGNNDEWDEALKKNGER